MMYQRPQPRNKLNSVDSSSAYFTHIEPPPSPHHMNYQYNNNHGYTAAHTTSKYATPESPESSFSKPHNDTGGYVPQHVVQQHSAEVKASRRHRHGGCLSCMGSLFLLILWTAGLAGGAYYYYTEFHLPELNREVSHWQQKYEEMEDLNQELEMAQDKVKEQMKKQQHDFQEELQRAQNLAQDQGPHEQQQQRAQELEQEKNRLQGHVNELQGNVHRLEKQVQQSNRQVQQHQRMAQDAHAQTQRLERKVQESHNQLQQWEQHGHESRGNVQKLEGDLKTSQQELHRVQEQLRLSQKRLEHETRNHEEQKRTLQHSIEEQTNELQHTKERLEHETQNHQEQQRTLEHAIQEHSKHMVIQKYGEGPFKVEFEVHFPGEDHAWFFVVELAPLNLMPHTVYTFLEQVHGGLFKDGGFAFHRNGGHLVFGSPFPNFVTHPRGVPHDADEFHEEELFLLRRFENSGVGSTLFPEYSPEYPHAKYTLGLSGRPSGPGLYINTVDNAQLHGPGGYAEDGFGDPCFAKVVTGQDVVDRMHKASGDHLQEDDWREMRQGPIAVRSLSLLHHDH